jgi:L-2-hydroxyglutarate oxidase LhgO
MDEIGVVVIGAGVIGLAVARELALAGHEPIVIESESTFGVHTSSRNSGVIHAGIYYPPNSLKAQLCREGSALLYEYAAERGIEHLRCGKLLVASRPEEVPKLQSIAANAAASGVNDLIPLSGEQANKLEPEVICVSAFLSPSTGIIDVQGYMLSLAGDIENAGGMIAYNTRVTAWQSETGGIVIETEGLEPMTLKADIVINAAGHGAMRLVRALSSYPKEMAYPQHFAKGNYFSLQGRAPFKRLVYPMPGPASLGIHATIDLAGRVRFGPDIEWVDDERNLAVEPSRAAHFAEAIRRYWPALDESSLVPDYSGIRPKIHAPDQPMPDFVVDGPSRHGVPGLYNLLGIESPGMTASLAMSRYVANMLKEASI